MRCGHLLRVAGRVADLESHILRHTSHIRSSRVYNIYYLSTRILQGDYDDDTKDTSDELYCLLPLRPNNLVQPSRFWNKLIPFFPKFSSSYWAWQALEMTNQVTSGFLKIHHDDEAHELPPDLIIYPSVKELSLTEPCFFSKTLTA